MTLIPDFQIHFYDAAAGRMLVEPYVYANMDLHGQFRYLDDNGESSYDLDYWFNKLETGAGVNLKLYAGLEIFDINIISYPKNAKRDNPDTFAKFSPIKKTPLWALPTLSIKVDQQRFLPTDSRSLLITGSAKNIPFPFGDKKTLNAFTNWVTPKVLFSESETEVPIATASLQRPASKQAGHYWFKYTKAGKYLVRLGGYSEGGTWLRQKVDTVIDLSDKDQDGMPDLWEQVHGISDPNGDEDEDELTNLEEFKRGLFPKIADRIAPLAPKNVRAVAGNKQITLSWDAVKNIDKYTVYRAEESGITSENYSVYTGGVMLDNKISPFIIKRLKNGKRYYFIVTASKAKLQSKASYEVFATPITAKLNDTGITRCADTTSNDLNCPVAGYPGQDADYEHNTMSFTKLSDEHCVKDNNTGLIWEVKQLKNDQLGDSLHDADDSYSWYQPDNDLNGGAEGYEDSHGDICYGYEGGNRLTYCNTHAYVQRVNAQGWCGYSDWRLPNRKELRSLVHYDRINPSIDTTFFRDTRSWLYWSSSSLASTSEQLGYVWSLHFGRGQVSIFSKYSELSVRLVRSGE